ncbi:uncharacterized protein TM35_000012130 [Trypanosoma theileri]|uniref:Transmembrane protein n=1 Tax=Trypanosoma theileri TaxID=67003 RepID=A0A1X0P8T5_9TRYP|nr:uncharacterized protein TM35_000012130 [Trypanosoma theileri]ORC93336.1 hypothetical protein TM35_000012130 [Trypanosoma theileri]
MPPFSIKIVYLLVLLIVCQVVVVVAEQLPDCNTVKPFLVQEILSTHLEANEKEENTSTIETTETTENIHPGISCLLRSGADAVVLLGSPEVRLQSPLRDHVPNVGSAWRLNNNDAQIEKEGKNTSLINWATDVWSNFRMYPWGNPAAIERFFFQRQFSLRFVVDAGPGGLASGSQLLSMASFGRIRVTSFTPVEGEEENSSGTNVRRLICNFTDIVEARRAANVDSSSSMNRITDYFGIQGLFSLIFGGDSSSLFSGVSTSVKALSPSLKAVGNIYLFEELGPHRKSSLWLPSWVTAWFGSRPMATKEVLLRGDMDNYQFHFDVEVPVAKPVCLRLASVHGIPVSIHVEESIVFDVFWLKMMLLLCVVRLLQPWLEELAAFQLLLAGAGSVVVLAAVLLLLLLRRLQGMTLGKLGLLAVLAVGGLSALAEGLLSAASALLAAHAPPDVLLRAGWIALPVAIAGGFLAKMLWGPHLPLLTRAALRATRVALLTAAALQNREATLIAVIAAVFLRPSRLFAILLCCAGAGAHENTENDPKEYFPSAARRPVAYATPLCVEGRVGAARTLRPEEKLYLYEVMGNEYTERALARLAKRVNTDPERYTSRLRDPKGVSEWAQGYQ